jgi:kinesin family protein 11
MYDIVAQDNIEQFMNGYNCTIFAYGQTGSGKTFSMLGPEKVEASIGKGIQNVSEDIQMMYGIMPRAILDIFDAIEEAISTKSAE